MPKTQSTSTDTNKAPRTRRTPKALAETAKSALDAMASTLTAEPAPKAKKPVPVKTKPANVKQAIAQSLATTNEDKPDSDEAPAPTGYTGPMLALRERAKQGQYKKAVNGQPSCGDEVATILGALKPERVIRACIIALNLPGNPYLHLNIGQQSMNLRNKLRGAMKRGEFGMGVVTEAAEVALEG